MPDTGEKLGFFRRIVRKNIATIEAWFLVDQEPDGAHFRLRSRVIFRCIYISRIFFSFFIPRDHRSRLVHRQAEDQKGSFPLSPFHVMFPKHLISRARAARLNTKDTVLLAFLLLGSRIIGASLLQRYSLLLFFLYLSSSSFFESRFRITVRFADVTRACDSRPIGEVDWQA